MNVEEFVNEYLKEHRHDVLLNPYNGLVEFAEALKAEALREAVEAVIQKTYKYGSTMEIVTEVPKEGGFKNGDKVRIIVIKENEK